MAPFLIIARAAVLVQSMTARFSSSCDHSSSPPSTTTAPTRPLPVLPSPRPWPPSPPSPPSASTSPTSSSLRARAAACLLRGPPALIHWKVSRERATSPWPRARRRAALRVWRHVLRSAGPPHRQRLRRRRRCHQRHQRDVGWARAWRARLYLSRTADGRVRPVPPRAFFTYATAHRTAGAGPRGPGPGRAVI